MSNNEVKYRDISIFPWWPTDFASAGQLLKGPSNLKMLLQTHTYFLRIAKLKHGTADVVTAMGTQCGHNIRFDPRNSIAVPRRERERARCGQAFKITHVEKKKKIRPKQLVRPIWLFTQTFVVHSTSTVRNSGWKKQTKKDEKETEPDNYSAGLTAQQCWIYLKFDQSIQRWGSSAKDKSVRSKHVFAVGDIRVSCDVSCMMFCCLR